MKAPKRACEVASLRISGNSTVSEDVIERISGLVLEPDISASIIRKRLLDTNLFSFVGVSRSGCLVKIRLRQKVTWFVLPYFSSDSGGSYYSLAAGKAVLASEDVFAFAWYQAGTNDHEATVGMEGRSILGSAWDAEFSFHVQNAQRRIYGGRDIVQWTADQYDGGNLGIGYRLSLPVEITFKNFVESHDFEIPSGGRFSGLQWSHRLSVAYDDYYDILGLGEGRYFLLYLEATDPLSDFTFYKLGGESKISLVRFGNFDWVLRPSANYSPDLPYYQLFELGGQSLRGFAFQQFRDHYDVVLQNDIFLYAWDIWRLKPRILTFADWAYIQGQGRSAIGAGFQLGVRDILLSAIQILAGYGFNPNGFALTLSLGQKF